MIVSSIAPLGDSGSGSSRTPHVDLLFYFYSSFASRMGMAARHGRDRIAAERPDGTSRRRRITPAWAVAATACTGRCTALLAVAHRREEICFCTFSASHTTRTCLIFFTPSHLTYYAHIISYAHICGPRRIELYGAVVRLTCQAPTEICAQPLD